MVSSSSLPLFLSIVVKLFVRRWLSLRKIKLCCTFEHLMGMSSTFYRWTGAFSSWTRHDTPRNFSLLKIWSHWLNIQQQQKDKQTKTSYIVPISVLLFCVCAMCLHLFFNVLKVLVGQHLQHLLHFWRRMWIFCFETVAHFPTFYSTRFHQLLFHICFLTCNYGYFFIVIISIKFEILVSS